MHDVLILEQLGNYRLDQYEAIVCRDVRFMPDEAVEMLRGYVREGGALIADLSPDSTEGVAVNLNAGEDGFSFTVPVVDAHAVATVE